MKNMLLVAVALLTLAGSSLDALAPAPLSLVPDAPRAELPKDGEDDQEEGDDEDYRAA